MHNFVAEDKWLVGDAYMSLFALELFCGESLEMIDALLYRTSVNLTLIISTSSAPHYA